ncbi:MAG: retropepsin-like aspartic protease [Aliidongia sp.]
MRCMHHITAAVLAALCISGANAAETCSLTPVASVPIDIAPDGLIFVNAEINQKPVKLRLELARGSSYLSDSLAKSLDLTDRGGKGTNTARIEEDGGIIRFDVHLNQVKLGKLVRNEVTAGVIEHLEGTDGTIGSQWLGGYDIEINPLGHVINMFLPDHCPGQGVYWADSFFTIDSINDPVRQPPLTEVMLDGKVVRARLDTGKSVTTLAAAAARDLFDLTAENAGSPTKEVLGITGGSIVSFDHVFGALEFGGLTFKDKKVAVTEFTHFRRAVLGTSLPDADNSAARRQLLLGMDVIGRLRTYIASKEQKIYFTLAADDKTTAAAEPPKGASSIH